MEAKKLRWKIRFFYKSYGIRSDTRRVWVWYFENTIQGKTYLVNRDLWNKLVFTRQSNE